MNDLKRFEPVAATGLRAAAELDWANDALWLSRSGELVGPKAPVSGKVTLTTRDGRPVTMKAELLAERFVDADRNGHWLPQFHPVQAIFFKGKTTLIAPNGIDLIVPEGGAVVRDGASYFVIDPVQYDKDYDVVGHRGTRRPISPFRQYPRDENGW